MLKPVKRSGGRRYYRPEDVRLIAAIDRLVHREGYTLRGARMALARGQVLAPAFEPVTAAAISPLPAEARERLVAIRRRLEDALATA